MLKGTSTSVLESTSSYSSGAEANQTSSHMLKPNKLRDLTDKFASYLKRETKGINRPSALATTEKNNLDQERAYTRDQASHSYDAQSKGITKGVSAHLGGRYALGMQDPRQSSGASYLYRQANVQGEKGRRMTSGTVSNGFFVDKSTMGQTLQSTSSPLRTLSSTPSALNTAQSKAPTYPTIPGMPSGSSEASDVGISNTTKLRGSGLAIGGDNPKILAMHVKSHKKRVAPLRFDYTFTSGQETTKLLQAFEKTAITLKNNGVLVADSPYATQTQDNGLYAKGAAAQGYTGRYEVSAPHQEKKTPLRNVIAGTGEKRELRGQKVNQEKNINSSLQPSVAHLGGLSAKFESGDLGIAAVGYDRHGGTSYGKFQISSRAGTMKSFISYLKKAAPDLAERLSNAGPANTGGRSGRMPTVWRAIANEQPERFENLQNNYIQRSHFTPALASLTDIGGVNYEALPEAIKEVVFSTAVQHGPSGATKIIDKAINRVGANKVKEALSASTGGTAVEQSLIRTIYAIRSHQFGSSSGNVQVAVKSRLHQEMQEALALSRGSRLLKSNFASNTSEAMNSSGMGKNIASTFTAFASTMGQMGATLAEGKSTFTKEQNKRIG